MSKIESAIQYMIDVANDNSHGYDQINRWSPDFDCSSLVITSWEQAGVPVKSKYGATYTGNMLNAFLQAGFVKVNINDRKRGDVLLNVKNHTAMCVNRDTIVQASINEKGTTTGGKTGDQTGKEIATRSYYNYPWDYCLRYDEEESEDDEMPLLKFGNSHNEVKVLQMILNGRGYVGENGNSLDIDQQFGNNTRYAVVQFQKSHDLEADGVVGSKTWHELLHS